MLLLIQKNITLCTLLLLLLLLLLLFCFSASREDIVMEFVSISEFSKDLQISLSPIEIGIDS